MIVVDSSVWIGHLRNQDRPAIRALRSVSDPGEILVGDLILLEVLRGARDERQAAYIEHELRHFRIERMLNRDIAVLAARHYRSLRRSGITMSKLPDLVIATYCIVHGYRLLHDDRDFDPLVERLGLRVVKL